MIKMIECKQSLKLYTRTYSNDNLTASKIEWKKVVSPNIQRPIALFVSRSGAQLFRR